MELSLSVDTFAFNDDHSGFPNFSQIGLVIDDNLLEACVEEAEQTSLAAVVDEALLTDSRQWSAEHVEQFGIVDAFAPLEGAEALPSWALLEALPLSNIIAGFPATGWIGSACLSSSTLFATG